MVPESKAATTCFVCSHSDLQCDSKLLSEYPWTKIFKSEKQIKLFRNKEVKLRTFYLAMLCSPHLCLGEHLMSFLKMATVEEKTMCVVLWFFEMKSVIKEQCRFRTQYGEDSPSDNAIRCW